MIPLAEGGAPPVLEPVAGTGVLGLLWLIILLPLAGAVVLLVGGRRTDAFGHLLGTATTAGSFVLGLLAFLGLQGLEEGERTVSQTVFTWFATGDWTVQLSLLLDPLSVLFVLLITGVGSLIHLYSIGYMEHDVRRRRFFGYLNLFVAAMLMLVMAGDYLGVFLGWEGVGLASYLLIGFWQHKTSAAVAAKKAFVVNRVGDMGLVLAVGLLFATFGTTSFAEISAMAGEASQGVMTAVGLLLLLAACGKSAQVPLQSWLLDAMEGPTPVSALIHAATMVTAGVYLVVRSNFIFEYTPSAQTVVVVVGCVTLLWGAVIGCAKDDIKKVLAGSTMSQIGYMMLAAGLGVVGYAYAIFHLITHGFFKAQMFLGAGSVMHAMDDDVDMRHYGALRKAMPITFVTFAAGYLAIIGFPGFSGFWSKDKIIEAAFEVSYVAGAAALIGAGVTAFYMTRLMIMTFGGKKRWDEKVHPHESPLTMTIPLIVLGVAAAIGGLLILGDWISEWLAPVVGEHGEAELFVPIWVLTTIVTVTVAIGIAVAWMLFGRKEIPREQPQDVSELTRAARADLYGDLVNEEIFMRPGQALVGGLATFDEKVVDGAVEGGSLGMGGLSDAARRLQNGFVRSYAAGLLGGALVLVLAIALVTVA
ncbi:NADH-quinone oxidoreductase subunit L [Nocardioidaceae bacterium]|nr:NADH-quinone oxidoreductase subunit L [Nocardioidaceae bacterium]